MFATALYYTFAGIYGLAIGCAVISGLSAGLRGRA